MDVITVDPMSSSLDEAVASVGGQVILLDRGGGCLNPLDLRGFREPIELVAGPAVIDPKAE